MKKAQLIPVLQIETFLLEHLTDLEVIIQLKQFISNEYLINKLLLLMLFHIHNALTTNICAGFTAYSAFYVTFYVIYYISTAVGILASEMLIC